MMPHSFQAYRTGAAHVRTVAFERETILHLPVFLAPMTTASQI